MHARLMNEIKTDEFKSFALLLICSILGFSIFKLGVLYPVEKLHTVFFTGALIVAALGTRLRMSDFVLPSRILLRTLFTLWALYILAAYPTMPTDHLAWWDKALVEYGRIAAGLLGVAALFRPSWGLILLAYILWYKDILGEFLGSKLSVTDYMPLIEVAAFVVIAQMICTLFKKLNLLKEPSQSDERTLITGEKIFLFAIAVHMANYLYSAIKKAQIGDHWLSWIFENQTQVLLSNAFAYGQLPIGFNEAFSAWIYHALEALVVPTNMILFFGQTFALFALLRIRWAIWTTLFYDLTHTVIFITSGIFFYKWIILNLCIVMALETMKKRIITPGLALMLMTMVLAAPTWFWVAHLGWWDTPQSNLEYFSAITKDGKEIKIPSNYFGGYSITFGQQRLIRNKSEQFLPTDTYGMTLDQRVMEQGLTCTLPTGTGDVITPYFENPDNSLAPFLRTYHSWTTQRAGENGFWLYDAYPHHIFSFPWQFDEFNALNLNDIVAYRYTIQSACVRVEGDKIIKTVQKEGHHDIRIDQP